LRFLNGRDFTEETANEYLDAVDQRCSVRTLHWETINLRAFSNYIEKKGYGVSFANKLEKPELKGKRIIEIDAVIAEQIIIEGTTPAKCRPKVSGDNKMHRFRKNEARQCLLFMLRTGLRISEALSLSGDCLSLNDNPPSYWVTRKGGEDKKLPLPTDMLTELRKRKKKAKLFECSQGLCNVALKRGAKKLGVAEHVTCHSLRHVFATNLLVQKQPIHHVSELLSHSSVDMTARVYAHLNTGHLSEVLNASRIVRHGLTAAQIFEEIEKDVKNRIDDRFKVEIEREESRIVVRVTIREGG
jgi:integrase